MMLRGSRVMVCGLDSATMVAFLLALVVGFASPECIAWQGAPSGDTAPPKAPKVIQLEGIVEQAKQLIKDGKLDEAIKESDKALALEASVAAAPVYRGIAFKSKSDYEKYKNEI